MLKEDYNKEPVHFCKRCKSLAIIIYGENSEYCNECGGTKVGTTDINNWIAMYKKQYGKTLL